MNAKLAQRILKMAKWNIDLNVPEDVRKKCVMIVAPHTSLWDWVLGKMVFAAMEIKPVVMIKKEFFAFPIVQRPSSQGRRAAGEHRRGRPRPGKGRLSARS